MGGQFAEENGTSPSADRSFVCCPCRGLQRNATTRKYHRIWRQNHVLWNACLRRIKGWFYGPPGRQTFGTWHHAHRKGHRNLVVLPNKHQGSTPAADAQT